MRESYNVTTYQISRDYALLSELMKESSIICIADYPPYLRNDAGFSRYVCQTLYSERDYCIGARGNNCIWADIKEDFIRHCARFNVEFIVPNLQEKEMHRTDLSDGWFALHNGDMSGEVTLRKKTGDFVEKEINVPYAVLEELVAERVRANIISRIEDAEIREILDAGMLGGHK